MLPVLDFDPVLRSAGAIRAIRPLRHHAFQPHVARACAVRRWLRICVREQLDGEFEYDYVGLGNRIFAIPTTAPILAGDTFTSNNRNGVNYLFNWGAPVY